ncbi:YIPF5-like protein [Tribonema minus]|uniref:Protein YIPF n=1 Tax=Tribonema minus TaxID=303371 RepID=A0A835Z6H4_9STRA|nr:YIPF5-like protein [Tribonema minus]
MYGGSDSFTPPPSGGGYSGAGSYASDPIGLTHGYGIGQPVGAVGGGAYPGAGQFDNEPPLLEELGINFEHIWAKTRAVLVPTRRIESAYLDETDLAGPLVFALVFGTCLLLAGKLHFGYIYGFGAFGCGALSLVLNLMGDRPIDAWRTTSVLGYCLLPVVLLSAVGIALDLSGRVGLALAGAAVAWSCTAATKLFEQYLDMRHQRWLIAYPIGLLYCCFVLMAIF